MVLSTAMSTHLPTPVSPRRGSIRTGLRAVLIVLVGTSVSIVHSGCQSGGPPEESGPTVIIVEEMGVGFADLPDGCTQVESIDEPVELACELLETTETPAGPVGAVRIELGEPSDFGIELEDVSALETIKQEHQDLFAAAGGEYLGVGGQLIYGPFGPSRYTRGRFQAEDGTAVQQIRLFMVHPAENRVLTLVYDHPVVDNADSAARINNHLLVLLENLRSAEELQSAAEDSATTGDGTP